MVKTKKGKVAAPSIAIVIPAYNEASVIDKVLDDILSHTKLGKKTKVIVVNDGSSDATSSRVHARKKVICIDHIVNMGAGAATRTGLAAARELGCDYAITIDADGQHKVSDAFRLLKVAQKQNVDLLIGSRLQDREGMPKIKVVGNLFLNFVSYLLLGIVVSDSQSGLRICNRKALETISYYSNGYAFCSEMIWRAQNAGLVISEAPIAAIYTTYSKAKGQKNVAGFFAILSSLVKHRVSGLLNE